MAKIKTSGERVNKIQILAYLLGLVGYPLVSFLYPDPNDNNTNNFLSIVFRAIFVLLCCIWLLIAIKRKQIVWSTFHSIFLFFWILYSCRILHDTIFSHALLGRSPNDYLLFGFVLSFYCSFTYMTKVNKRSAKYILVFLFIILIIINCLIIYNFYKGAITNAEDFYRLKGNDRLNPISTGLMSGYLILISIYFFIEKPFNIKIHIGLLLAIIFLCFFNLFAANSKGPIIAVSLSASLLIGNQLKKHFFKIVGVTIAIVLFFKFYITVEHPEILSVVESRFLAAKTPNIDESTSFRIIAMKGAIQEFIWNPFFGSSLEEKIVRTYPHNMIIESFMATGIVGGIVYLILLSIGIFCSIKLFEIKDYKWVSLIFILQTVLTFTSGSLVFNPEFWYVLMLVISIYSMMKIKEKKLRNVFALTSIKQASL